MRKIILGSASPRRKELLEQMGLEFEVCISNVEETIRGVVPQEVAKELAAIKGHAVAAHTEEEAVVIGADTIVAIDGMILGKPKDEADAVRMLEHLQGRTHQVYTGVCAILKTNVSEEVCTFCERTDVTMYPMTEGEIRDYVQTKEPMDKAGAYGIQGKAGIFIRKIQGDYHNVVGLPIARLYHEIRDWL